jgi:hypothetical protein
MLSDFDSLALDELVPPECFDAAAEQMREDLADQGGGRFKRALAGLATPRIASAIGEKFRAVDLLGTFAKGWADAPELAEAAAKTEGADQPSFVRLGKLEQELDLFPLLSLSAWGLTAEPIKFTLNLQSEFEAVEVGLHKGYLIQLGGGFCRLAATLKLGPCIFPSGIPAKELQLGRGRQFDKPGIALLKR